MLTRRAILASASVAALAGRAQAQILISGYGGNQSASAVTVTDFSIGYFGTFYSWSNLTVSGTTVTDASNTNFFMTDCPNRPLTIGGKPILIASRVSANQITLASAPGNGTGISATLAYPGTVINRAAGSNSRTVTLSGTYSGSAPSALDCKLTYAAACVVATPGATFQNWTTMGSLSAAGGTWSATINVPLCNDWVVAQIRDHYTQTVLSNVQVNFWGVGVIFWASGQSNLSRMIQAGTTSLANSQDSRTRAYDHSGWHQVYVGDFPGVPSWSSGTSADNEIRMMNEVANALNCVCGMMTFTSPGTAIQSWLLFANGGYPNNNTNNIWTTSGFGEGQMLGASGGGTSSSDLAGINSSTLLYATDFEAALWQQGENDVGSTQYGTRLTALFNQLLSVNGRSASHFNMCVVPLGTQVEAPDIETPATDSDFNLVREAQQTFISSTTGAIYGGGVIDATHNILDTIIAGTAIHWCGVDYVSIGKRYTQSMLQAFGSQAYGAQGPVIASASWTVGTNQIVITVTQGQGTELLDAHGSNTGSGLQGFALTLNGSTVAVSNAQITGASQITLTAASNRTSGQTATVAYTNGANPYAIHYAQWTNLTCPHNSTTVTDASSGGLFTADMVGTALVVSAGTNFTPGSYTISSVDLTSGNFCVVGSTPTSAGAGSAGVATVSVNSTPDGVSDNFPWTGALYPDTRGLPLQPTNGPLSIP